MHISIYVWNLTYFPISILIGNDSTAESHLQIKLSLIYSDFSHVEISLSIAIWYC